MLFYHLQVEILATTILEKRLRAIDKTLDRIEAATQAKQEQEALTSRVEEHNISAGDQAGPNAATASRELPPHMFSTHLLEESRAPS